MGLTGCGTTKITIIIIIIIMNIIGISLSLSSTTDPATVSISALCGVSKYNHSRLSMTHDGNKDRQTDGRTDVHWNREIPLGVWIVWINVLFSLLKLADSVYVLDF